MTDDLRPTTVVARPANAAYARRLPHLQTPGATIFITFATWQRWTLPERVRQSVIEHVLHDHGGKYILRAAVVMPDHVHVLLTPQPDAGGNTFGLAEIMHSIKSASAHTVNRTLGRRGRVWQPEYFDRALRSDENARLKAEYICANPVRAGLVSSEDEWPWLWREWIDGAGMR